MAALAWAGRIVGSVAIILMVGIAFGVTFEEARAGAVEAGDVVAKAIIAAHAGVEQAVDVVRDYVASRR
jgi:hypothetical protein